MSLCYIDEAGNGQTLDPSRPDAPPVLVVGSFTVHDSCIKQLTWDFLTVKKTYRPQLGRARHLSEVIHTEVKGADVRKDIRVGNRDRRRAAMCSSWTRSSACWSAATPACWPGCG